MILIGIGIICVVGLIKVFATTEKNNNGSRGWNHTPNMTVKNKR